MNNTVKRIDKELVRRRFSKHLKAYDSLAVIQQRIARTLAGMFSAHAPGRVESALEVGCGTGFLTRKLLERVHIERLYLNDLVPEALPLLKDKLRTDGFTGEITEMAGDAEHLEMPKSLDLVASASVLQWFDDLPGFFEKTAAGLKPEGWFVFNLFGPGNLHQIKTLTGFGLRYLPADELRLLLKQNFEVIELRRETIRQEFETPFDVLRHLQQTGVTGTGEFRWTPGRLREFEREYVKRYEKDGKVALDWDVIYVIAKKK